MTPPDIEQLYCNLFLSKLSGCCFILFLIINVEKSGINLFFLLLFLCFVVVVVSKFLFLVLMLMEFFPWNETLLIFFSPQILFAIPNLIVVLNLASLYFVPIPSSEVYTSWEFPFILVLYVKHLLEACWKDKLEILKNILLVLEVKLFHKNSSFVAIFLFQHLLTAFITTSFLVFYVLSLFVHSYKGAPLFMQNKVLRQCTRQGAVRRQTSPVIWRGTI